METRYRWAKLGVLLTLVTFDILQASITANYAENLGLGPNRKVCNPNMETRGKRGIRENKNP